MGLHQIAAKTGHLWQGVGKVEIPGFLELFTLLLGQDFKQQAAGLLIAQRRIIELLHLAVQAEQGRRTGGDMQVACALLLHHLNSESIFAICAIEGPCFRLTATAKSPSSLQTTLAKVKLIASPGRTGFEPDIRGNIVLSSSPRPTMKAWRQQL